jgi:uracil-xanthine permease
MKQYTDKVTFLCSPEEGGYDCTDFKSSVLVGKYSYRTLCVPEWPWCRKQKRSAAPFFGTNELLPLTLAAVMGLQHALAMIGGLIVPPLLVASAANDPKIQEYLISVAMICSGVFTLIHVIQIPIPFTNLKYGTGILSVVGISFTFLQNTQSSIALLLSKGYTFNESYGKLLGTMMVCCWIVVVISFMPNRVLRRIFPPHVSGIVIFLIGAALVQSAFYNWGGGAFCGENTGGLPPKQITCQVPDGSGTFVNGTCFAKAIVPQCSGNGHVVLPFGSPEYLGLGFLVFVILVFIELFGSPFMRNSQIIIALLLGYLIAGVSKRDGLTYVDTANIKAAPGATFLWVYTFPIGFYAPAVLPYLVSFIVTAIEGIGDITATEEVSKLETSGEAHRSRIQGGLLADGVNCFFGALATSMPSTTFAQNNGVINVTRVASRSAGVACGIWLILLGIIAKIGAFFTSIPNCVLGGVTSFLFANVAVSGLKIIMLGDIERRTRFILSLSLALGLGVNLVPNWATNSLWNVTPGMSSGVEGFRDACILVLSSGYSIGALMSIILHLLLPLEQEQMPDIQKPSALYDPTAPKGAHEYNPEDKPVEMADMRRDDTASGASNYNGLEKV